ncbi:MAG: hypothetical protein A2X17_03390 [Bacteroidetes bacterium GWF2_41_61]|nr:MAG: hypothetical protein A2X17_03390 [Bacteroidetes bacterium GWF2_41_61]OFY91863.1 MAG: hypothetical protein A2266_01365 [Bacteroidetes bacterium RIFOXYA12_FULL_40_10]HBG24517.1 hypothetical protein [Rikenellaceae bacterium]
MDFNLKINKIVLLIVTLTLFKSVDSLCAQELQVTRERTFTGTALYGFMNGGSDLYLEYDFKELRALEVTYKGEQYTIEIYKMPTPEDAFGIYSLHTFRCSCVDTLSMFNCFSPYQMQAVIGDIYFSIVYENSAVRFKKEAVELLAIYSKGLERREPTFPAEISTINPVSGRVKYIRGKLALVNGAPGLCSLLEGVSDYKLWVAEKGLNNRNLAVIYLKNSNHLTLLKEILPASSIVSCDEDCIRFEF